MAIIGVECREVYPPESSAEGKIAIVSDKPQTTRTRILVWRMWKAPRSFFSTRRGFMSRIIALNRRMVRTTLETFDDADVLYVVVEATSQPGPGDLAVIEHGSRRSPNRRGPWYS